MPCLHQVRRMIDLTLSQCITALNAKLVGDDAKINQVSIDSRTITAGSTFVAICGENFDGHEFLAGIEKKGAAAAIVAKADPACKIPQLVVEDTRIALGQLAKLWREQLSMPIIAITGSCGKTTTKNMLAAILQQCGPTCASESSLNNDYGLPLSLLAIDKSDHYAVVEMGTNHFGEIDYLTKIAKPTVAVLTMAAAVHLTGLGGDVAGVAKAKGEIFNGLPSSGLAVLNADDPFYRYWCGLLTDKKVISFSFSESSQADIYAKQVKLNQQAQAEFILQLPEQQVAIQLPLLGEHHVTNALAASAAAYAVGADIEAIAAGLQQVSPANGRLSKLDNNGVTLFDDSYNSNPQALEAALKVLADSKGRKILVLGDMGELAEKTEFYHRQAGEKAREFGVDALYAFGAMSSYSAMAFGEGGLHFSDQQQLIEHLLKNIQPPSSILIKGSRSMHLEHVVNAVREGVLACC